MAIDALLLFGAPPVAEQYREVCVRALNVLISPAHVLNAAKFAYETRAASRELMTQPFPPFPFESGEMHVKVFLDGARIWLPVDQDSSVGLARRRVARGRARCRLRAS